MLSNAAVSALSLSSPLLVGLMKAQSNPHSKENPKGIINLGTAENRLLWEATLFPKIREILGEGLGVEQLQYPRFHGSPKLCTEIASLLNEELAWTEIIDESNIVCNAGCGATVCNAIQALCNAGEGVMIPTPYYGGFDFDIPTYAMAKIIPVACNPKTFISVLDHFKQAFKMSKVKITTVLLTNPSNPLGTSLDPNLLLEIVEWAVSLNLHVISDEIYALSVFSTSRESPPFKSLFSLPTTDILTLERKHSLLHVLWGFSKDFTLNGIRLGVCASYNPQFLAAMRSFSVFSNISSLTDFLACGILKDKQWRDMFLRENRLAITKQCSYITSVLDGWGVEYIKPTASFFIWVNLSKFLNNGPSTKAEEGFARELSLWDEFIEEGVMILPGQGFHCPIPGWFRIVYAFDTETVLSVGLERIGTILGQRREALAKL